MYLCLIITIDRERSTRLVTVNTFRACVYFAATVFKLSYLVIVLTLYDPGGGFKSPPPLIFCSDAFNFRAAILCVGDFSQKIV